MNIPKYAYLLWKWLIRKNNNKSMFKCSFKPGDKVYCVNNHIMDKKEVMFFKYWPIAEKAYTVRDVILNKNGLYGLTFEEIHNPKLYIPLYDEYMEPNYSEHRFLGEAMYLDIYGQYVDRIVDELIEEVGLSKE